MSGSEAGDVYRLVFELTARATDVPYEAFLEELVQGLAAHYRAEVCRLHIGGELQAVATADEAERIDGLDNPDRARFDTIDQMLAEAVRADGVLRSAHDLDGGEEVVNFLTRSLKTPESFAFPLMARGKAFGAITLYLLDIYPFGEDDVRGLQAIGNVLYAASNPTERPGRPTETVPVTSAKLRAYQDTLEGVDRILDELLFMTQARTVLLLDSEGDFIAKRGEECKFSTTNFATVVASGFAASRRLSGIYGASEGRSVLHEGERDSVFVIEVGGRALLVAVVQDQDAPTLITRWVQSAAKRLVDHYNALTEARVL